MRNKRYSQGQPIIKVILSDLKRDFRGTVFFQFRQIIILLRRMLWTLINLFHFYLIGVKVGKSAFTGWCIISRYPRSTIVLGKGNSFNSAKNVNLIGVNRKCIISTQSREAILEIGDYCGFSGVTIAAFKQISIGNNVKLGANVLITDSDWHPEDCRSGESKPVIIHDNVWLGVNAVILKGVIIGKNTVIGANSVVTSSIPENVVAAGNPCRIIKNINI